MNRDSQQPTTQHTVHDQKLGRVHMWLRLSLLNFLNDCAAVVQFKTLWLPIADLTPPAPMSLKCRLNYFSTINSIASQTSLIERRKSINCVLLQHPHTTIRTPDDVALPLFFFRRLGRVLCRDSRESISRDRSIDQVPTARDEWARSLRLWVRKERWDGEKLSFFLPHLHTIKKSAGRKE